MENLDLMLARIIGKFKDGILNLDEYQKLFERIDRSKLIQSTMQKKETFEEYFGRFNEEGPRALTKFAYACLAYAITMGLHEK